MTISVNLPSDAGQRLAQIAQRLNLPSGEPAATAVGDLVAEPPEDVEAVARRVPDKNREPSGRLA